MAKNLKRQGQRLQWIVGNTLYQSMGILWTFILSYFVITETSTSMWGAMVEYLIVVNLIALLVNWGQNGYLNRLFSRDSSNIYAHWQSNVVSRAVLLLVVLFVLNVVGQLDFIGWVLIWVIVSFMTRAFDPIHLFERKFGSLIMVECLLIAFLFYLFMIYKPIISIVFIIQCYLIALSIRLLSYCLLYQQYFTLKQSWYFDASYFKKALPFFLPALIGFLQTRIDLYAVAIYLEDEALGAYQVFFKVIAMFFMFSRFLMGPFLKNIYRMSYTSLHLLNQKIVIATALLAGPMLFVMKMVLSVVYHINVDWTFYVLAYGIVVCFYGYVVIANLLIRFGREYQVVRLFSFGLILATILNAMMVPNYGVLGALLSTFVVQCILLILFRISARRLKKTYPQKSGS